MIDVKISPKALMKMQTLVMGYDKEVGWYGLVDKVGKYEYRITDILVFPQYTSGVFVDDERDDPEEHRKWLDSLSDEEYEHRRLWGHSHVNMGVSPSGTDIDMFKRQKHVMSAAAQNKFILCVILNKKLEMFWWAYDADEEREYKDKEINVMFEVEEGVTNVEYYEKTKSLVRDIRSTTDFIFGKKKPNHLRNIKAGYNYGGHNKHVEQKNKDNGRIIDLDDYYGVDAYNQWIEDTYDNQGGDDDNTYGKNYSVQIFNEDKCEVTEVEHIKEELYDMVCMDSEDNRYGIIIDDIPDTISADSILYTLYEAFSSKEELYSYFVIVDENGNLVSLPKNEKLFSLLRRVCSSEVIGASEQGLVLCITLKEDF